MLESPPQFPLDSRPSGTLSSGPGRIRPELLAPAGDADSLRAAIENGADAVYFGLNHGFNARARATNVALDALSETFAFLHARGVKGYVTLNTLIFQDELPVLAETVRQLALAGADAVLVQDLGVARLIREIAPDLPIHASTQMTLTSAENIRVAERLGIERVVLARELSIDEIRKIHAQTSLPLEAFVHGALCVAYSGQCLTSESLGGRSANRGQCAQACRLPYEVLRDGRPVDLGQVQYLLSPQDLAAYELIPRMIDAGVMSLKIEGRLKTPEYVANITRHYRQAIEMAVRGDPVQFARQDVEEMELSFSRGFSPGWLLGCDHKRLVPGLSSAKRGVLLGEVVQWRRGRVQVRLACSIKPGDGIVFAGDRIRGEEQGGRVYEVFVRGSRVQEPVSEGLVELTFARDMLDPRRLEPGQAIWKTDDPTLTRRLRRSFSSPHPQRKLPVQLEVWARVGEPLRVKAALSPPDRTISNIEVQSEQPLEIARQHSATPELLQEQLGRLGKTPYSLDQLTCHLDEQLMIPLSLLGKIRKTLVKQLDEALQTSPRRRVHSAEQVAAFLASQTEAHCHADTPPETPQLKVLCRTLEQLRHLLNHFSVTPPSVPESNLPAVNSRTSSPGNGPIPIAEVYADFQDIREYREAVRLAREVGVELLLATPRIQKPSERGIFHALLRHEPDGILVRNLAGLDFFTTRNVSVVTDYSLNVTNELTAHWLAELGAGRITVSYDLNRDQLVTLVQQANATRLEVVIHQHMPMFHMEHCVFCAVLSPGTNKTNCGRPCDRHKVELRDRLGSEHPLTADVGCRNTLFNAVPQSAAEAVPQLLRLGIRHMRIEFLRESAEEISRVVETYQQLLSGSLAAREVWRLLKATNRVGVTRGTLEARRDPLAIL
jgi:U32 family peptidase